MAHPGGRPPIYNNTFPQKVLDFLALCVDVEVVKKEGKDFTEYKKKVKLPTFQGLSNYLGVNKDTISEWDKKYPEFSVSLDVLLCEQHDRLVNNGLSSDYNSTIAKLILSSNHGYVERKDQTTNGKDLPVSILNGITSENKTTDSHI